MARILGTGSNLSDVGRMTKRRATLAQTERIRLIHKYYPELGKYTIDVTVPKLAAEWYSDLAVSGVARIEYHTDAPYRKASNKLEFLACLDILLTEAEKYSHQRGYGWRQHFAATDLNPTVEARLEISGNETIRAVRDWHTEISLPPIEGFLHRVRKIELWQNEQYQLTTMGLEDDDWRDVYNPLFLDFRRAIFHTEPHLLRAAYVELKSLLPTLHTRWLPPMEESMGEEITPNDFHAGQLVDYWSYCEFVPLRPTSSTSNQRDPCLIAWLSGHIRVKQWYVWDAVKMLAEILNEPVPETPLAFQPPVPKPSPLVLESYSNTTELPQSDNTSAPTIDLSVAAHPWGEIEAIAERIGLRQNSSFILAPKWVGAAVAGMIDALRDAGILPTTTTLEVLYADFTQHYNRKISADRDTPTRINWRKKARKAVGLDK